MADRITNNSTNAGESDRSPAPFQMFRKVPEGAKLTVRSDAAKMTEDTLSEYMAAATERSKKTEEALNAMTKPEDTSPEGRSAADQSDNHSTLCPKCEDEIYGGSPTGEEQSSSDD